MERGIRLVLSCFTRVTRHPSRLRIKSAMTGASCPALWIPAYAGMTAGFAKVDLKEEGAKERVKAMIG